MADSQSKMDAAAEKAFAEAADRKTAEAGKTAKPEAANAPVEKAAAKAAPASKPAAEPKPVATKPEPQKSVEPAKAAATPKAKAKPAPVKPAARRKPAPQKAKPGRKPAAKKKMPAASAKTAKIMKTAKTAQPPISQLKEKIMATAKTTDFSKTFTDAAADIQSRVKAAYEKGAEMTADLTEFHKGNFEAVVESGKALSTGVQDMSRSAIEDMKGAAETATDDVKKMAAVKSPTELFQLQGEIVRRNFDAAIAHSSKTTEAMMKLANDFFAPLSSRASIAAEKLTKVA